MILQDSKVEERNLPIRIRATQAWKLAPLMVPVNKALREVPLQNCA